MSRDHNLLKLEGELSHAPNSAGGGGKLPSWASIDASFIENLINQIYDVIGFWEKQDKGFRPVFSVFYNRIVAKSNRISAIFREAGVDDINDTIVGSRFSSGTEKKHIITYCMSLEALKTGVVTLENCRCIVNEAFSGRVTAERWQEAEEKITRTIKHCHITKTRLMNVLHDLCYIGSIKVDLDKPDIEEGRIVTLFDTGLSEEQLFSLIGLDPEEVNHVGPVTWYVTPVQYRTIKEKAAFLISMSTVDICKLEPVESTAFPIDSQFHIPSPAGEPVIGVIDTLFSDDVYFREWVEFHDCYGMAKPTSDDYEHGTAVTSLLVDGPALNPVLEDGCGRFRVRHFGTSGSAPVSTVRLMQTIEKIIDENRDIAVWNLSLGSELEIDPNFISPEAAIIDNLVEKYNIIFIIAGTNKSRKFREKSDMKIGSPADSVNSIVVGSVGFDGKETSYSRKGPVLEFYSKPDVCAFGGDNIDKVVTYTASGRCKKAGTSFAAPWIARKVAYLIYKMKLTREAAKALIIDSAVGWNVRSPEYRKACGYGQVPLHIDDVLKCNKDEIRFVFSGIASAYNTYAYNIPLPVQNDKFAYKARIVLSYFPSCSRSQGVDYTDQELNVRLGRLDTKQTTRLVPIRRDTQGERPDKLNDEDNSRAENRKWDNVKVITEGNLVTRKPKDVLSRNACWGIDVFKKNRRISTTRDEIPFAVVVTFKELNGRNRIDEFARLCRIQGWQVSEVNQDVMIQNYIEAIEEIDFED